jgi:hypothetical protein
LTWKVVRTEDSRASWQPSREKFGGQAPRSVANLNAGQVCFKADKGSRFHPKNPARGIDGCLFAFAMTLLVINIELPEGFHPKTNQEFLHGLSDLSDTFVRPFG